jgi:hypothetical protein
MRQSVYLDTTLLHAWYVRKWRWCTAALAPCKVVTHSKLWPAAQTAPRRARIDDVPLSDYFCRCMTKYLSFNTADACVSPWDFDHTSARLQDVCSDLDKFAVSTSKPLTLRAFPGRHAGALIDSEIATNREKLHSEKFVRLVAFVFVGRWCLNSTLSIP